MDLKNDTHVYLKVVRNVIIERKKLKSLVCTMRITQSHSRLVFSIFITAEFSNVNICREMVGIHVALSSPFVRYHTYRVYFRARWEEVRPLLSRGRFHREYLWRWVSSSAVGLLNLGWWVWALPFPSPSLPSSLTGSLSLYYSACFIRALGMLSTSVLYVARLPTKLLTTGPPTPVSTVTGRCWKSHSYRALAISLCSRAIQPRRAYRDLLLAK